MIGDDDMNKRFKKISSMILVCTLAMAMLGGCSKNVSNTPEATGDTAEKQELPRF